MTGIILTVVCFCIALTGCAEHPSPAASRAGTTETISIRVSEGTTLALDVSADGRWIVFDLLGQLWLVPGDGGDARAITDAVRDTAEDLDPSFSPDADRLVFRAERRGRTGLWLLDLEGNTTRQLTQLSDPFGYEGNAAWSPDGKLVAFARVAPAAAGGPPESSIALLDVASGVVRALDVEGLPSPDVRDPAWAPDGGRIALVVHAAGSVGGGRVWVVAATGGRATPLTAETVQAQAPAFAPDGRSISFLGADSAGRMQVWVQAISDSDRARSATRLTNHADVAPTRVRWSADGKSLLYSADGRLWKIPAAGGVPSEIPFTAQLSFTRPRRALPPARFPEPGKAEPARAFLGLALAPDARSIAAIALAKLWIIPVGGVARAVTDVPHTARHVTWSPDGTEVAWSAGELGDEDLFATDVETGTTRQLTKLRGREVLPAYSPDGRSLAFAHVDATDQLRVIDAGATSVTDTAQTRSLGPFSVPWTASNVATPQWSPASDALLFTGPWSVGRPTRGVIAPVSGAPDTIARFPDAPIFLNWTAQNSIVFVRHDRLWQASFDGTGMRAPPRPLGSDPALYASTSQDGTVLYISEDGLRLRSPGGVEQRLGWSISYTPPVPAPLLIRNVRIVDGTGAPATSPRDILIQRGRIARISAAGTLAGEAVRVADAAGRFVIPGLMELHAHNYVPELLPGFLYFGVMTVRDQGADIAPVVAYADAIAAGVMPGPRVTYGGFQFYSDWPFDEEQGRGVEPEADTGHVTRAVALAGAFGSQHIKTRTFRRWDITARIIAEAHRRGMRATGHCAHPLPLVAAGIDAKEHIGLCAVRGSTSGYGDMIQYDDVNQLFRAAGIAVVPTISYVAFAARLNERPGLLESDAELAPFMPPMSSFAWMLEMSAEARAEHAHAAQQARETTAKLARAGVTIGTGTDIWQLPAGVHMELEELVAAGLSPAEAIHAATGAAARIIGAESDLGTIEVGKWADLVLLDGDPLANIRNTRRIWSIVQAGRLVDRPAILQMFTRR